MAGDAEWLGGHREDERGFRSERFDHGAKVGLCGELATVGADGLAAFDSGGFEVAGGGQGVEGGDSHGHVWEPSDQPEHAKADDEQEGGDQADCPSDSPELNAHTGNRGVQLGLRGEGVHEPGFEVGKIDLRDELATVGADGLAHGAGDGFRLAAFDSGGFEVAGGGQGVEGGGGHGRAEIAGGREG